jgi:hypothetical protein
MKHLKVLLVAGARPSFMKIAPPISTIKKLNNSIDLSRLLWNKYVRGEMQNLFHRDPANPRKRSNSLKMLRFSPS